MLRLNATEISAFLISLHILSKINYLTELWSEIMKKFYESPSVEKIAFRYRDQIVAASGNEVEPAPTIGGWTNEQGTSGCKWYVAEAWGIGFCNIV